MKILKPGREQTGWSVESKCTGDGNGGGGCGALLLVEASDLYITTRCCRDEVDEYTTYSCPQCGVETDIGNVPWKVLESARRSGKRSAATHARDA